MSDELTPKGENQQRAILTAWDSLQTVLAVFGAVSLLSDLLKYLGKRK
jgi:hypothetical protein